MYDDDNINEKMTFHISILGSDETFEIEKRVYVEIVLCAAVRVIKLMAETVISVILTSN